LNYTITVDWSDGVITKVLVDEAGTYVFNFGGPAWTTATINVGATGSLPDPIIDLSDHA